MGTLKRYQKLIIRMLSPQNINLEGWSESELEVLRKGLDWYGHFLSMIKITSRKMFAPAASFVDKEKLRPIIYINDEFFDKYPLHEQIAIMKHEVLHILNEHFQRDENYKNKKLWNVATDLAINQLIPFIPEDGLHIKKLNNELGLNLKENMPAEYYYKELEKEHEKCQNGRNNSNNNGGLGNNNSEENNLGGDNNNNNNSNNESCNNGAANGENNSESSGNNENKKCEKCEKLRRLIEEQEGLIDSHELWENLSETEKKIIKESLENLMKEATTKSRGNAPAEIEEILKIMREKNKINWKKYLKRILSNKKIGKAKTIKRRDRRFPKRLDIKGNKKDITGDLLVILDVSGSMSNKEIEKALNELFYIIKNMKYKVHLIEVDTEPRIYPNFEKDLKQFKFKRMGSGGTYLFPGIKKADEMKLDYGMIIIVTDGYIESLNEWEYIPKKQILFLLTEEDNGWGGGLDSSFENLKNVKILKLK